MKAFIAHFRKALWLALEHDVLNTAKAVAYSGMLMMFPALVVLAALLAVVPEGTSFAGEMVSMTRVWLMWGGTGNCTKMPSTESFWFRSPTSFNSSASLVEAGSR